MQSSLGDQASGMFVPPFNNPRYQQLSDQLQRLKTDEDGLSELGQILFDALFQGMFKDIYTRSQGSLKENQGLLLRLDIDPALGQIAGLPWEFLYDPDRGPLALLDAPIVRYLPQSSRIPSLKAELPLKVLVTGAHTPPQADVERELHEVVAALSELGQHVQITVEPHLTPQKLQLLLRQGFHVWHFIGHGGFAKDGATGQLLFEDATGGTEPVSALQLGILLNRSGVRLVMLDACQGGKLATDPFRSMAPALIRAQIPAVIAMQFTVPQESTRVFAGEFYRTLAEGFPIDACVTEGRKAVVNATGLRDPDWGIPAVYTRVPDGRLFDLQAMATPETALPSQSTGINITIGSGQQLREGSSINISGIGNTNIGTSEQRPNIVTMPREPLPPRLEEEPSMPSTNEESFDESAALREEITLKKRRLQALRLQAARGGSWTDPQITMEIEDLEKELPKLEQKLQLENAAPTAAQPTSQATSSRGAQPNTGAAARSTLASPIATPPEAIPFTLRITEQGAQAGIIWEADVIGRRQSTFRSPYDGVTLPVVIKGLDALQYGREFAAERLNENDRAQLATLGLWSGDQLAADIHKQVGRAIYNALVADPVGSTALRTTRDYATAEGKPLAYLFRFPPDAVNLAALPWELMWDQSGPLLLSRGKLASWVRYLDLDQALPPAIVVDDSRPLRILTVAPQAEIPEDIRTAERQARTQAWDALVKAGNAVIEELSPTTRSGLIDRIQNGPPVDILHFYGHGRYRHGEGALLLDKADGGLTWVSADQLAALLSDVRLVMLHACKSGMVSDQGLLSAVAPALSAAGIPAVVAMQLTVQAEAGTRFAGVVYRNLARGVSIQHAVNQARQALFVEDEEGISWYVPTLTIRARDTGPLRLVQVTA